MIDRSTDYCDIEMSARLRNILQRGGIKRLEELKGYPKESFITLRNMGEATLSELYALCAQQEIPLKSIEDLNDKENGIVFDLPTGKSAFRIGIKCKEDIKNYDLEKLENLCSYDKRLFSKLKKLKAIYG